MIPPLSDCTLNPTTPSVRRAKCLDGPGQSPDGFHVARGKTKIVSIGSFVPLISPGDANPTLWGAGIQVPGRFRGMLLVRPFFLPTEEPLLHKRIHCSPEAEVQWSSRTAETNRGPSPAHVCLPISLNVVNKRVSIRAT